MTQPSDPPCKKCSGPIELDFKPRKFATLGYCRKCAALVRSAATMARRRASRRDEVNAEQRAYKAAHPDRIKKYRQDWNARHPGVKRDRDKAYRDEHREALAKYFADLYAQNSEQKRAAANEWRLANPERYRELQQRRRARVRGATVGPIDVDALWTGLCGICGEAIDPDLRRPNLMSRSIDHIMPLSRGGSHTQGNLRWTHLVCNLRKGSKMPAAPAD